MENGSPPSDGKSFYPVKHVTHVSGGLCACDHPAPRSQRNRGGRRGGAPTPRGSSVMRQKTHRTAAENQEDLKRGLRGPGSLEPPLVTGGA